MNLQNVVRKTVGALVLAGVLLGSVAAGIFVFVDSWYTTPAAPLSRWQIIDIPFGSPLSGIATLLNEKGLINNPFLFKLVGRYWKKKSLKAGEYRLNRTMTPENIFSILQKGKEHLRSITFPEGMNIYETAAIFEKHKFATKKEIIRLSFDKLLISQFPFIKANSLEGYLFPSTYFFRKGEAAERMIKKMVSTFEKVALPEITRHAKKTGLSPSEIVVLASLIEKETGLEEEKRTISSVFTNRLKKRMRLQCDPTVIYALKNFDGNIRKKDLLIDSPYNTYRYKGLPPGPITNPGKTSVLAALHPLKTDYLYFVATKKGGHFFSQTLKTHNRAVRKFQLNQG